MSTTPRVLSKCRAVSLQVVFAKTSLSLKELEDLGMWFQIILWKYKVILTNDEKLGCQTIVQQKNAYSSCQLVFVEEIFHIHCQNE